MARLAINGGKPLAPGGLDYRWPIFDDTERQALLEVLESGRWCSRDNPGGKVAEAGRAFARFIGTKHGHVVSSGTTALELALRACGIGYGDEVIVPSVTFLATASAVVTVGAVPVFVDIDPSTYQISPDAIEAAIGERTRALLPVHYGGYPADMDRISEIASRHGLRVIEDAAEAHGTEWRGKRVGSLGDMGCFSFQMSKSLTSGEGGAVTFDDPALAVDVFSIPRTDRAGGREFVIPTGNWRMSEFVGAVLLAQLERLEGQIDRRHENIAYLLGELDAIDGLDGLAEDPRVTKVGWFFNFLRFDSAAWGGVDRDLFLEALKAEGIQCGTAHNEPLYLLPLFRKLERSFLGDSTIDYSRVRCPEAERIYETEVVAMLARYLDDRASVDLLLAVLHKLRDNVDELIRPSRLHGLKRRIRDLAKRP